MDLEICKRGIEAVAFRMGMCIPSSAPQDKKQ